jgi:3-oxoacyl-[acyl-carrier-protein] synthase II
MEAFINAMSCISHHPTFQHDFFFHDTPVTPSSAFLFVNPPAYKDYIPANTIRRTSHILKMGISAGLMCLRKNPDQPVDAIIVGSAMGCFEDTDKFLRSIAENDERMLTPTSFIQSTHNTVAGQLALLEKCHGYNFTYVHQNLSFEYALLDALLLLKEAEAKNILVGGVDELIPPLCELFERAGHIKSSDSLAEPIWNSRSPGYVAGEGATFFNLGAQTENSIAKIKGVKTITALTSADDLKTMTDEFLDECGIKKEDLSLVLSGISGDATTDKRLKTFTDQLDIPVAFFKHLCGEYFTSSAFATWFAANILKRQIVPACAIPDGRVHGPLKNILIINHYRDQLYSLICVSEC